LSFLTSLISSMVISNNDFSDPSFVPYPPQPSSKTVPPFRCVFFYPPPLKKFPPLTHQSSFRFTWVIGRDLDDFRCRLVLTFLTPVEPIEDTCCTSPPFPLREPCALHAKLRTPFLTSRFPVNPTRPQAWLPTQKNTPTSHYFRTNLPQRIP